MARNRIIAGLARAVLVVQTKGGGGAIAAARRAVQLGRPAFAIDWQDEPYAQGCRMLKQVGARLIPSLDAFLEEKPWAQ